MNGALPRIPSSQGDGNGAIDESEFFTFALRAAHQSISAEERGKGVAEVLRRTFDSSGDGKVCPAAREASNALPGTAHMHTGGTGARPLTRHAVGSRRRTV